MYCGKYSMVFIYDICPLFMFTQHKALIFSGADSMGHMPPTFTSGWAQGAP